MKKVTYFTDSPDAGPDCICSWCGQPILDVPARFFSEEQGLEARFHLETCFPESALAPDPTPDDDELSFGLCCACGRPADDVHNFIMLDYRAPLPGTGWGCFQCGLPLDGAMAIVCDGCLETDSPIRWVIYGQASACCRMPIDHFEHRPFKHRMALHPEVTVPMN